jgi:phosphoglycolate phosphatase-like HAD superfamily hydrolase
MKLTGLLSNFRIAACVLALLAAANFAVAQSATDPLPAWNDGPAKHSITDFIAKTTTAGSPDFVAPADRIATFDQDGTLWVEQPMYPQVAYAVNRLALVLANNTTLQNTEPYKTALSGNATAIANLPFTDLEKIFDLTLAGMSVEEFYSEVQQWLATAQNPRWHRPYTDLTYEPMQEVLRYFRANGYKTYIVTGGGQDYVRVYADQTYGIPPEQIVGTINATSYGYDAQGRPVLTKVSTMLLEDVFGGKPEGIHLMIGRRPYAAFGNSTGDQQMLEYTKAGSGLRLAMLVFHDDAIREYAYGPAQGLPDSKIGPFTQALYDEAQKSGWFVISMKNDWNRIFSFDPK